jgi:antitoxin YefM
MKVINYTDLRLNLKKWLDVVVDDVEEIIVTRKNNKDLLSGKNRDVILKSLEEAKSKKTIENDLLPE